MKLDELDEAVRTRVVQLRLWARRRATFALWRLRRWAGRLLERTWHTRARRRRAAREVRDEASRLRHRWGLPPEYTIRLERRTVSDDGRTSLWEVRRN